MDRCLTEPGGGDGIHVDFLVAGALVTGSVGGGPGCHWTFVAMATGHLVHALDHTRLKAFPAGRGALQQMIGGVSESQGQFTLATGHCSKIVSLIEV